MSHCDDFKKNLWKCSPFAYFVQLQYCDAILWWLYDVRTLKTLTLTQNLKWILPVWKVTVWQKMGKSVVENEKSWMWNVFYVLVAFILVLAYFIESFLPSEVILKSQRHSVTYQKMPKFLILSYKVWEVASYVFYDPWYI